jgi:hypothetical protein
MPGQTNDILPTPLELGGLNAATARTQPQAIDALAKLLGSSVDEIRVMLSKVHGRTLVRNVFGAEFTYASGEAWAAIDEEGETGIEEEIEGEPDQVRPYDPDKIRVDPKNFSLQQLLDDIDSGDLDLAPDFQRNKVWGPRQKVRLVESVLLRIPLPAFYFSADKSGRFSVVDGVQRLSTLHGFLTGEFALTKGDLEYLTVDALKREDAKTGSAHPDRCSHTELDAQWTRRLRQTQLMVNVIDPQTPEEVKFEIFKRINTGGSPLNAQEIRHSMMKKRGRDLLRELSESEAFLSAVPITLHRHPRMADREVVLRLLAFILLEDVSRYRDTAMDAFLMAAARRLDDPNNVSEAAMDTLRAEFEAGMRNAAFLFGDRAFRKWPPGKDRFQPFNKALFESWGFALRGKAESQLRAAKAAIVRESRELMNDRSYLEAITVSTGDVRRVRERFQRATAIVEKHAP